MLLRKIFKTSFLFLLAAGVVHARHVASGDKSTDGETDAPAMFFKGPVQSTIISRDPDGTVTTSTGLRYLDLVEGQGTLPKYGQKLTVRYTGYFEDGRKFDSSDDNGASFQYLHEVTYLIRGWTEGVSTMKVGGKRKIIIPPRLAYGNEGLDTRIPPGATLIYEIELLSAED